MNKATFRLPGGGTKDRGLTKIHNRPGVNAQYVREMLDSQKCNKETHTVTEAEEESMFNRIWNEDYREKR